MQKIKETVKNITGTEKGETRGTTEVTRTPVHRMYMVLAEQGCAAVLYVGFCDFQFIFFSLDDFLAHYIS